MVSPTLFWPRLQSAPGASWHLRMSGAADVAPTTHALNGNLTVISAFHCADKDQDNILLGWMAFFRVLRHCPWNLVFHTQPEVAKGVAGQWKPEQWNQGWTIPRYIEVWTWPSVDDVRASAERAHFGRVQGFWDRQARLPAAAGTDAGDDRHMIASWNSKLPAIALTLGHQTSGLVFWLDGDLDEVYYAQELANNWRKVTAGAGNEDLVVLIATGCFAGPNHPHPGLWFSGSCCELQRLVVLR